MQPYRNRADSSNSIEILAQNSQTLSILDMKDNLRNSVYLNNSMEHLPPQSYMLIRPLRHFENPYNTTKKLMSYAKTLNKTKLNFRSS
jgi:hypothetical protein